MTTLTREEIQRLYGSSAYQVTDNDEVIIEADEFVGKLTGTADKAIALANPYTLKLIGDASGEITLNNTSKQMQVSVSHATNADNATHATSADNATRTTYCDLANIAHYAYRCGAAAVSNRSLVADNAITANSAIHADSANTATSASRATYDASGNAIDTTFASHNDRISRNATKNTQQDLRLDDLENYTELKEWKATTTYKKDKVVVYEDNLYRSKVNNNLNHLPAEQNSAYWKLLSETASGGTADCVHINNTETITGDKTFTGLLIADTQQQSDNSQKVATTSFVHSAVNTLATNVYTKSETYNKTEINDLVTPKADNNSVVHLASAETITGIKTFSNEVYVPTAESSDNSTKVASTAFVKSVFEEVVDKIYPVGSIYISVNNTSPSALFGGEWEQIQEKFLLSAGNTHIAGTTGGEFNHTLTIDEMPAHNHTATTANSGNHNHDAYSDGDGGHNHTVSDLSHNDGTYVVTGGASPIGVKVGENWSTRTTSWVANHTHVIHVNDGGTHSHSTTISNTGSGTAMNITPPYLSVYMWQRTA